MSQEKEPQPAQITDQGAVEIREEDLDQVHGGAPDAESTDDKHRESLRTVMPGANKIAPGSIRTQKV